MMIQLLFMTAWKESEFALNILIIFHSLEYKLHSLWRQMSIVVTKQALLFCYYLFVINHCRLFKPDFVM